MDDNKVQIVLGSSSSARQSIMKQLCLTDYQTWAPDIDEKEIRHPDPYQLPLHVARGKMEVSFIYSASYILICVCGIQELKKREDVRSSENYVIITADQIVLV